MLRNLLIALALAVIAAGSPASASGSFSCSIDDKSLVLDIEGTFSHGLGAALVNFGGTVGIKLAGPPETLRKLEIARENAPQYWLQNKDFRLGLYKEQGQGDVHQTIDIVIVTSRKSQDEDDIEYLGTYVLEISHYDPKAGGEAKTWKAKGKASCSVG